MNAKLINSKKLQKNLERHGKSVRDMTRVSLRAGALLIQNEASENVSVKSGNLKRSITHNIEEDQKTQVAKIGTPVEYAPYVEFGTRPHTIRATNKKALANKKAGVVFGKTVNHPGSQAKPFLRPAFESKKDEAIKEVEDALDELIKKWNR